MKFITFPLIAILALQSCSTTDTGIVTGYLVTKYLKSAKSAQQWQKRHDQLQRANMAIIELNATGVSAAALQAIAAQFTDNEDVVFVVALLVSHLPQGNVVQAPNNEYVTQVTAGVTAALAMKMPEYVVVTK